jgi:hypothetical protein
VMASFSRLQRLFCHIELEVTDGHIFEIGFKAFQILALSRLLVQELPLFLKYRLFSGKCQT